MIIKEILRGVVIASAVGALFAGCGDDEDTTNSGVQAATVKCQGINDCKGTSDCSGANNDCKGLNDCKGEGYLLVATEKECADKGGTKI